MKYDAATRYIRTIPAGNSDYYAPRKRGTVIVRNDGKIHVYSFGPNPNRAAAKKALAESFRDDGKLSGSWPEYRINP